MIETKQKPLQPNMLNYTFSNELLYRKICGINDSKLPELEDKLGIKIIPRGNTLLLGGEQSKVLNAIEFFTNLVENFSRRPDKESFDSFDVDYLIKKSKMLNWTPSDKVFTTTKGKPIYPRTKNQEDYVISLLNNQISMATGPAGTGKTFLSTAVACRMLQSKDIDRIILTRPAVEAGESLGFLPGDLTQKVDPYLRPIYDALYECLGFEKVQDLISANRIEIAPIAFMRGRTLSHSYIILDEAQNCTIGQLKMLLTRIGKNSKMCLSGDVTQIDLDRGKSGFEKVVELLKGIKEIGTIYFDKSDITRNPLIETIVNRFETI